MDLITLAMAKKYTEKRVAEISGESSSGVQADWNQNDEVAPDYIKNRPFSETINFEIMIEHGGEAKVDEYSDGAAYYLIELAENTYFNGIIGNTYVVELNGIRYETTLGNCYFGNYLGNLNLAWAVKYDNTYDGTGLPFGILFSNEIYFVVPEEGIYDLKIGILNKNIKVLDTKFLPDKYPKITYTQNVLLDNFALEIEEDYTSIDNPFELALISDRQYNVVFDDTIYKCICSERDGALFIGNMGNDLIPFCIRYDVIQNMASIVVMKAGSHSITIIEVLEETIPIDKTLVTNIVSGEYIEEFDLKEADTVDEALHRIVSDIPLYSIRSTFDYDKWGNAKITYGNGRYVVIHEDNLKTDVYAYSDNGVDWTEATLPSVVICNNILYGNGIFLIAGSVSNSYYDDPTRIFYSIDGVNWETKDLTETGIGYEYSDFINGKFYVSKKEAGAFYSENGIDWSHLDDFDLYTYRIVAGNGTYFAFSRSTSGDSLTYRYSNDEGVTWTEASLPHNGRYKICFGDGKFVIVNRDGTDIFYSYDGLEWFNCVLPKTYDNSWRSDSMTNVCYTGEMFVCYNNYKKDLLYSVDGIKWKCVAATLDTSGYECQMEFFTFTEDKILGGFRGTDGFELVEIVADNKFDLAKTSDICEKFATKEEVATMAILTSPNGTKYRLAVSDDGTLSAIPVE